MPARLPVIRGVSMPTHRVIVRPPTRRDRTQFLERVRESRSAHRSWVSPPSTPADFDRYVAARSSRFRPYLVCRCPDGAVVGVVNASEIVRGHFQSAYLGYYGFHPHLGRGYMTEGVGRVIQELFTREKLHRVEANIQPSNDDSIRLVKRLGFRKEGFSPRYLKVRGRWRDHERWALLREDWRGVRGFRGA